MQTIVSVADQGSASDLTGPPMEIGMAPACTRPGQTIWSKVFNDPTSIQASSFASIAADEDSLYVAGTFSGTIDFGGGPLTANGEQDAVIARFTHNGAHVWSRQIGGAGNDIASAISVDAKGQVCAAGIFTGTADFGGQTKSSKDRDVFLACYGPDQSLRWVNSFAGKLSPQQLLTDRSGDITLLGSLRSPVDLGGGLLDKAGADSDVLLAKFKSSGEFQYAKYFGASAKDDAGGGLALDSDGSSLLTGFIQGPADFGGGLLTPSGPTDAFLAKYTDSGALVFAKLYGGMGLDMGTSVAIDSQGGVFTTGGFNGVATFGGAPLISAGKEDIYLAKYNRTGAHIFSLAQGGPDDDLAAQGIIDGQGELVLAGTFTGRLPMAGGELISNGGQDIFLTVRSADGAPRRASRFGGADDDTPNGIAQSGSCNIAMAGLSRFKNNTGASVFAATLSVVQP